MLDLKVNLIGVSNTLKMVGRYMLFKKKQVKKAENIVKIIEERPPCGNENPPTPCIKDCPTSMNCRYHIMNFRK
jgi:hypothetical protein